MTLGRVLKHCIKKYERRFFIGVRIFNVWRSVSNVNRILLHQTILFNEINKCIKDCCVSIINIDFSKICLST